MKKSIINIIFLIILINLSGCSLNYVPNNSGYSRTRHVHNEYCGHTGYYYNNKERKNTNLHYYDPNTGRRKHYDQGFRNNRRKPKFIKKLEKKIRNAITGNKYKKRRKKRKNKYIHKH